MKSADPGSAINKVRRMEEDIHGSDGVVAACGSSTVGLWWFDRDRNSNKQKENQPQGWQLLSKSQEAADVRASLVHGRVAWVDTQGFHLVDMETGKTIDRRLEDQEVNAWLLIMLIYLFLGYLVAGLRVGERNGRVWSGHLRFG